MQGTAALDREIGYMLTIANRIAVRFAIRGVIEAEDIAQDAMLRMLARKSPLAPTAAWMYKSVRSAAFDAGRKRAAEAKYLPRADVDLTNYRFEEENETEAYVLEDLRTRVSDFLGDDVASKVRFMLQQLTPELRQILLLSAAGHSYKEMAEIAGVNLGTVRSRVHYARKQARSLLSDLR